MIQKIPKENVSVIHDDDLDAFLDSIGILNKFKRGELKCKFCRTPISYENFHSIFPQSGDIKLVCDNVDCIKELANLIREGQINL
jgi:hypothetical protein